MTKHLWLSNGIAAHDPAIGAHKARLECIERAINELGRLRSEWGMSIDSLPADVNVARESLWRAYHSECDRRPNPMPKAGADSDDGHDMDYAAERAEYRRQINDALRDIPSC